MQIKNNNYFNKITILLIIISLITAFSLIPLNNAAADDFGLSETAGEAGLTEYGSAEKIPEFLGRFAGAALALSGSIFLFLVVYGGIIILTSAGNQEKVTKGKNIIIWAIVGAMVLGGAYAITYMVFSVFQ